MATERTLPQMATFFKFSDIGQWVAGKIAGYKVHEKNGPFVIFSPIIICRGRNAKPQMWNSAAVGLSTDLRFKVQAEDVGKFMSFNFVETEPTTKGSRMKRFRVLELDGAEMKEVAQDIDRQHKDDPYRVADGSSQPVADETEEDMPF